MARPTLLSGFRPTGRLHLGHLHGTLKNWVRLQESYRSFFFVADWHALTTKFEETEGIAASTREMVADWLAVGLDPERSVIFRQSALLEHAELFLHLRDDHADAVAAAQPHRQGTSARARPRRLGRRSRDDEDQLRPSRLSGAAGRRHPRLQSEQGARRRRSGAARRVHPRARAALQPSLPAGVSRSPMPC